MSRVVAALAVLACAAPAVAAPRTHVDPDAVREARRAGDAERAVEHLKLAVAYDEQSPELRVALAEALALVGQLDAAEVEARRALELAAAGAAAPDAHVLLGRIQGSRHRTEQAVVELKAAIRIETALAASGEAPDAEPWRVLATVYVDAGEDEAA